MRTPPVLAALAFSALALSASAQERNAAQRQTLVELSRVLGEAQALHQVCADPDDPAWRSQFQQMLDVEAPDEPFAKQLNSAFNRGFAARKDDFAACGPASRMAEAQAALEGRDLAAGLAQAVIRVLPPEESAEPAPDPMAEGQTPR